MPLAYPLDFISITTPYSSNHTALDLGWDSDFGGPNVPVLACANGIVTKIFNNAECGNTVEITYDNGFKSQFMHCADNSIIVKVGERVKQFQRVATMGDTGKAYGNHVHFILFSDKGNRVNPLLYCYAYPKQIVYEKTKKNYNILYYNSISYIGKEVTLNSDATVYQHASLGVTIPNTVKGKQYTVKQEDNASVLLEEINSWVLKNECTLIDEKQYTVNSASGLWLLDENGRKIKVYPNNTKVSKIGQGYQKYGYNYIKVKVQQDNMVGYMATEYLK